MVSVLTTAAKRDQQIDSVVIWLHGLGADGNDFVPLIPALTNCNQQRIQFVFPHAPQIPVTINGGMQMRAWYDIRSVDLNGARDLDQTGMQQSGEWVASLIQTQIDAGISTKKIVLAGFSQGGVIALQTGLKYLPTLAGVMALSCYFPLEDAERLSDWKASHQQLPDVFLAHGQHDPVVPFALGQQTKQHLEAKNWPLSWHEYPIQHGLHPDEAVDIDHWLASRLNNGI